MLVVRTCSRNPMMSGYRERAIEGVRCDHGPEADVRRGDRKDRDHHELRPKTHGLILPETADRYRKAGASRTASTRPFVGTVPLQTMTLQSGSALISRSR